MRNPRDTYPTLDKSTAHEYYKDAQWLSPGIAIMTCKKCGAWVTPMDAELHQQWHERLRRAVDETEMLG